MPAASAQGTVTWRCPLLVIASHQVVSDAYLTCNPNTGRITSVGRWADFRGARQDVIDLEGQAILPALVNAHTHLEFSDLSAPIPSGDGTFADWIRQVVQRRFQASTATTEAYASGIQETRITGTAALGDIVTAPHVPAPLPGENRLSFLEMLGLHPDRQVHAWQWVTSTLPASASADQWGLSPHAPYSTATALYEKAAQLAKNRSLPLATHLAETTEERQLLQDRSGPLVDLFRAMQVWHPDQIQARGFSDVIHCLKSVDRVLLIHGNFLEPIHWQALPSHHWSIVYCPQTHQQFGHPQHPWPRMLKDGVNVALGTDSRASSPTLNLWSDFQIACNRNPEVHPSQVFAMATRNGAAALGLLSQLGTLETGKQAALLKCPISTSSTPSVDAFWQSLPQQTPLPLPIP